LKSTGTDRTSSARAPRCEARLTSSGFRSPSTSATIHAEEVFARGTPAWAADVAKSASAIHDADMPRRQSTPIVAAADFTEEKRNYSAMKRRGFSGPLLEQVERFEIAVQQGLRIMQAQPAGNHGRVDSPEVSRVDQIVAFIEFRQA